MASRIRNRALPQSLIGNFVRIENGPAAVIGDAHRKMSLPFFIKKVGRRG